MSREIKRLHRKQTQFTDFPGSQITKLPNPIGSVKQNIADASDKPLK